MSTAIKYSTTVFGVKNIIFNRECETPLAKVTKIQWFIFLFFFFRFFFMILLNGRYMIVMC